MSLIKRTNRPNRDYSTNKKSKIHPEEANIIFKVHWNSNPIEFEPKDKSPDIILNYQFGLFKSTGLSDIRNLVSSQENNAIMISTEDNKLYVDDSADEDDGIDYLAHYLLSRG